MKKTILFLITAFALLNFCKGQNYVLYGMTSAGGVGNGGVLFSYNPFTGKDTVLHSFSGHPSDGASPEGTLMYDSVNGFIYGETYAGGTNYFGTLFCLNLKTDKDSLLVSFNGANGENPTYTAPMLASNAMIYGVTESGGDSSQGVIFRYNPANGKDTVVFNFNGTSKGGSPDGSLIQATNGLLYGIGDWGGISDNGVLYSFDPATNTETVLLKFNGTDGSEPEGSLIQASNGLLYGATTFGGAYGGGTLFSYNPVTNTDTIYLSFGGYNGKYFYGNLLQAYNGLLYGMCEQDGLHSNGIIFTLDPSTGIFDTVFSFNGTNGSEPWGSLVQNPDDSLLYGMTYGGGTNSNGVLFSFNTITKKSSVLVNFSGANGSNPFGSLLLVKTKNPEGIEHVEKLSDTKLYPNPNKGVFIIQTGVNNPKLIIEIYNVLGEEVYTAKMNTSNTQIDISNKSKGIYLYRILAENSTVTSTGKFIIQ